MNHILKIWKFTPLKFPGVRQGSKVHFQVLEGVVCRFGHKVDLQYKLSSIDRWTNRESQQDIGGHVEDVCDASTMEVGRVSPTGRFHLQQWVS